MHFYSKCFYLMYIFNYIVVGSSELKFHAMALGHSGLLIYWDPTKLDVKSLRLIFTYKALILKQGASHQVTVKNMETSMVTTKTISNGQTKLISLNEDTEYEITITDEDATIRKNYTVKCKTNLKNNSPPEKPYFTWKFLDPYGSYVKQMRITWVPCGRERNCHGNEAGTHFAVKIKVLDSRQTATIIQDYRDSVFAPTFYVGKIYEVIVISINGNSETSSDPEEVFLKPCSSPVHSVKFWTLSNASVFVFWKGPKWFTGSIDCYFTLHTSKSVDRTSELLWDTDHYCIGGGLLRLTRFDDLKPNTIETFTIIPRCEDRNIGFEYRVDYLVKPIQTNLPLAKPDFKFVLFNSNSAYECEWLVYWIPCPEISDCKNMNLGSSCEMEVQDGNKTMAYNCRERDEYIGSFVLEKNRSYKFIGKSVNEFNQTSDSFTRQISCDMHEDTL